MNSRRHKIDRLFNRGFTLVELSPDIERFEEIKT